MGGGLCPRGGNKRWIWQHIARSRGEETGKVVIVHGSKIKTCEATPIDLVDEPKESCTGARRIETGVTPRYVNASRGALPHNHLSFYYLC